MLYEMQRNSTEVLRFEVREYKGKVYADIRTYYQDGEEWKPTKKGLSISPAIWSDFVKGIGALGAELEARGLLEDPDKEEEGA